MKKYGRTIVLTFCVLGLAASLIMNVVLLRKTTALRLLDVTDVGLAPLLGAEITEMYIDEDNNPDFRGTFQDQEVAEQLKTLLENAVFQAYEAPGFSAAPGSGTVPYLRITTPEHTFTIGDGQSHLEITIDGVTQRYTSNIRYSISCLINEILDRQFDR